MAQTFLEIAEIILKEERKPLKPEEIIRKAIEKKILVTNGKTPEKSMKARISTEIIRNGFSSKFMRYAPNRFVLRELGF
ncbi:MAG: winged helix-turn-helix domain-containing protein, partial [Nitrospinae bacterium]|nr:winged helix-turn-helix domain-containing protein [Nitrospinota bacterium]